MMPTAIVWGLLFVSFYCVRLNASMGETIAGNVIVMLLAILAALAALVVSFTGIDDEPAIGAGFAGIGSFIMLVWIGVVFASGGVGMGYGP